MKNETKTETAPPSARLSAPPDGRPAARRIPAILSGVLGLLILLALTLAGGRARDLFHLSLPGPVIGLAFLAAAFLLVERFHAWSHRHLSLHLVPVSRVLISHMGLLFVPAGVGIITEGARLRHEWLPIVAALLGSTLAGLVATAWIMHRFAPKDRDTQP